LNERQKRFIAAYIVDPNATNAAKIAGYSEKTAYSIGQRLLKNVEIKQELEAKTERLNVKTEWTKEISVNEAKSQYERWKEERPEIAHKYKENLDRLNGLLVERKEVNSTIKQVRDIDTSRLTDDELVEEIGRRVKLPATVVKSTDETEKVV